MARPMNKETMRTAEDVFRAFLRDRGLKYTSERANILGAVMRRNEHFEAEELLRQLWQEGRRVGKATVYRTLKLLVECGIVRETQFRNKQVHYEHSHGQDPHDHMLCRHCGRIIEFDAREVVRLRSRIAAEAKFHPLSHRFAILGVCAACQKAGAPTTPRLSEPARTDRGRRR